MLLDIWLKYDVSIIWKEKENCAQWTSKEDIMSITIKVLWLANQVLSTGATLNILFHETCEFVSVVNFNFKIVNNRKSTLEVELQCGITHFVVFSFQKFLSKFSETMKKVKSFHGCV